LVTAIPTQMECVRVSNIRFLAIVFVVSHSIQMAISLLPENAERVVGAGPGKPAVREMQAIDGR
jgi:hypothetical protein